MELAGTVNIFEKKYDYTYKNIRCDDGYFKFDNNVVKDVPISMEKSARGDTTRQNKQENFYLHTAYRWNWKG